jgi:vitamin B12 transporter
MYNYTSPIKLIINTILFYFFTNTLFAQDTTTINLSEVTVTANFQATELRKTARNVMVISEQDIKNAPVKSLDGILQYALNVDVRSRVPGVQADISIRGGNFDQTLILLDGVKMNDPQTGHHSLNLPVPIEMIERIEVLQGGASRVFGPSAFSGVINIITKKNQNSQLQAGLLGGAYGLYRLNAGISSVTAKQSSFITAENTHSDGYALNTAFNRRSLFAKSIIYVGKSTLSLEGGLFDNRFGASNFYHPKFYNQYEEVKSQMAVAQWQHNVSNNFLSNLTASWRRHYDMYDFDNYRNSNKIASINFHRTDVYDLSWIGKWINTLGITTLGAEWRSENIMSNRLGDKLALPVEIPDYIGNYYTFGKTRENGSFYIEHLKKWQTLSLTIGSLYNVNSQFGAAWFPGLDVSWAASQSQSIYASANRSLRFPTFTEMYLNGSTVKGDPNIKPENAWTYEIGTKRFTAFSQMTVAVFAKNSITAIDKVKRPDQAVPTMENINNLHTFGFEASYALRIAQIYRKDNFWLQRLSFNYAYIWADKKEEGFQSFYTLNYLRHKLSTGVAIRLAKNLNMDIYYTFKQRDGQYQWDATTLPQNYTAIHLVDTRLAWQQKNLRLFLDCTNVLNQNYYDYGFVQQPGRWLTGGISYVLK